MLLIEQACACVKSETLNHSQATLSLYPSLRKVCGHSKQTEQVDNKSFSLVNVCMYVCLNHLFVCINHLFVCIYVFGFHHRSSRVTFHHVSAVLGCFDFMVITIHCGPHSIPCSKPDKHSDKYFDLQCIVTSITLYVPYLMQERFKWYAVLE